MRKAFERSLSFTEPFHGRVWLGVSRIGSPSLVRLIVSIEGSWDADLLIAPQEAAVLARALSGREAQAVKARTPDDEEAVVVAGQDRLALTVLGERLSDVLVLDAHAKAVQEFLATAAAPDAS